MFEIKIKMQYNDFLHFDELGAQFCQLFTFVNNSLIAHLGFGNLCHMIFLKILIELLVSQTSKLDSCFNFLKFFVFLCSSLLPTALCQTNINGCENALGEHSHNLAKYVVS